MSQRRVVMGRRGSLDAIVSDEVIAAVPLAAEAVTSHAIWGRDDVSPLSVSGELPEQREAFPPPEGFRYAVLTIPAGANGPYHQFIQTALAPFVDPDRAGMHWTPTLDCIVVTAGELLLEGDEDSVTVSTGDSVIINGNRHRWTNIGQQAAVIHAISLGTRASQ